MCILDIRSKLTRRLISSMFPNVYVTLNGWKSCRTVTMAMELCPFIIKLAALMLQPSWQQHPSEVSMYWGLHRHSVSRHTFNFPPLFSFQSWQWESVLIDIWREKKWLYLWRNAVIFKDKPATANWKRKSPLLCFPCLLGPEGSLSHLMGIQQPPDDIFNIIAPLGWVCLFGVYI